MMDFGHLTETDLPPPPVLNPSMLGRPLGRTWVIAMGILEPERHALEATMPMINEGRHSQILRVLAAAREDVARSSVNGRSAGDVDSELAIGALDECRAALKDRRDHDDLNMMLSALEHVLSLQRTANPAVTRALKAIQSIRRELYDA